MSDQILAYGLWGLVVVNSAIFIMFAYSFFKPRTVATGGRSEHSAPS